MRSRAGRAGAALLAAALLAGCASTRPRGGDVALDALLARLSAPGPRVLEGSGRLGIRTPEGDSSLSFRLAFDAGRGLRLDVEWTTLVGLLRREGALLVRGDSVWIVEPEQGRGRSHAGLSPFEDALPAGLTPSEFVDLLVGRHGDLARRGDDVVAFRRLDGGPRYAITMKAGGRLESLTADASTGDLLERTLDDPATGRRVRVIYERHARAGAARRPFSVDIRDSEGPVRVRFLFSGQRLARPSAPGLFDPPRGARLVGAGAPRAEGPRAGTFAVERGSW
jgi:hypothetical protein